MSDYKLYQRTAIAELADWVEGFDMVGVSVSEADLTNGSPKAGDKIARNPVNHEDRWLVAAAYFAKNFAPHAAILAQQVADLTAERDALCDALANSCNRHIYSAPPGMVFVPSGTVDSLTAERDALRNERDSWKAEAEMRWLDIPTRAKEIQERDALLSALVRLSVNYRSTLAGLPVRDADEALCEADCAIDAAKKPAA